MIKKDKIVPRKYKPENNEICNKAVIFARVSSEKQEKGASIDAQKSTIYEYCERQISLLLKSLSLPKAHRAETVNNIMKCLSLF